MTKRIRRLYIRSIMLTAFSAIAVVLCGSGVTEQGSTSVAAEVSIAESTNAPQDKALQQLEKLDRIYKVLKTDRYGTELEELYQQYPRLEELILNRGQYPDALIEYLLTHEEAVNWVIDYPEAMKKTQEEITEKALIATELKEYSIQNNIPVYYQWDKAWGYASYGSGCIAIEGCGPTSLSMVAAGLTGDTSLTPKRIADMSVMNGYYSEESGTDWSLMSEGAQTLGLQVTQPQYSTAAILAELSAGHPIICSMGPGDFTQKGHFIVLTGVDSEEKIIVNDPNSHVNTERRWDAETLLAQMKGMWAYSVS